MAKPKKYISSKLKVKRKFVLGGDTQQELYLNGNTTYQAVDLPTAMLQHQFDTNEQLKAKQNTAIFGNQLARQMDYLQDLNADITKRNKEEETARQQQAAANKQAVDQQVTQTAGKAGKQLVKDYKSGNVPILNTNMLGDSANMFSNANIAGGAPLSPTVGTATTGLGAYSHPFIQSGTPLTSANVMPSAPSAVNQFMPQGLNQGTYLTGQGADAAVKTGSAFGQNAAAIGKSLGKSALVALPQIAGQIAYNQLNKVADRDLKNEGRSQYYDDTEYSRKEFNAQLAKSTGKGATIGGTIGSVIPGVGTGIGMAVGTVIGGIAGAGKAVHQRRMTKSEDERGVKIGNKRFGKKLLFGEENVYDENLDPTVIEKRNREAQLKAMTETANAMDNAALSSMTQYDTNTGFNLKTTTGQMAKYGGKLEYLKGGVAKSLGRGAKEYIGNSHEEGGIDLPGNIEVEGGETEQNNYIFSKHLKLPTGISYAQAHKNLLKSGASSEEIKQLALSQEAAAGRNPNEIKTMKFAKYGGPLKYENGGNKRLERQVNRQFKKDINDELKFDKKLATYIEKGYGASSLYYNTKKELEEVDSWIEYLQKEIEEKKAIGKNTDKLESTLKKYENKRPIVESMYQKAESAAATDYFKDNPEVKNFHDWLEADVNFNYDTKDNSLYQENQAARTYTYRRLQEKEAALENPPVPMKGKDAGKLSRTPKLAAYTLPNIKVNSNNTSASDKVEELNYFTSGQFAKDQAEKGPESITKGRTKEYWQNLEDRCRLDPFAEGCTKFNDPDEAPNLAGSFAAKRNAMNRNIALGEEVPTNFFEKDFASKNINSYSDYMNAMKFYDEYQNKFQNESEGTYEAYNKDLLPNLTEEEFEFYRGQRNSPDMQSYVTDERLTQKKQNTRRNAQLWQDTATGEYIYRAPDGTEIARSMDQNQAGVERDAYFAKRRNSIGVAPPANNTVTEDNKTYKSADLPEVSITGERPKVNTEVTNTTTQNNPPTNITQNTTTTTTNTTQTNSNQPVVNTNPSGTVTYTTSDKVVTKPTTSPTDNKPRFFMGAIRIVDENGNVKVLTDKPLTGHNSMAGSRLGTPTIEGLADVRYNSYDAAGTLKKDEDYKNKVGGASLSFSDAVNDRETIAGTDWGKRWGYRTGMSAAEAQAAHDAFASEMRTKFDQSPDEMLGYYQYLIDSGYTTGKDGKRTYGKESFGDDARAIYENLKSKGHIDSEGKIKPTALPYLREQATDEFVGPIHNAAGAYSLKGKPTINKIVEDTPPPGPVETPKKDYSIELPPPPKYTPTEFNNKIGLLQTIPAAYAIANPINVKPIAPSLAMGYVTPGGVARTNIGRVSYNTERAANQGNLSAMNQALQNMSGPGAVAGMLAAKTKADQQNLAIANAEQNANIGLAAKEADLNAGISKFNVGNAMQAQTTNAGIAQQNAARMQQASQFNTQLKYAKDVENREQILGALDRGAQTIVQGDIDKRKLQSTERLAGIYDAYQAYNRYLGATQAQNNAIKKEEEKTTQAAKFGGAKKYISRLGDLKNVKYKV